MKDDAIAQLLSDQVMALTARMQELSGSNNRVHHNLLDNRQSI